MVLAYLAIGAVLAIITIHDGLQRGLDKRAVAGWAFVLIVAWPVSRGVFEAVKPLRTDELRVGGLVWHVIRSAMLWWTLLMLVFMAVSLLYALYRLVSAPIDVQPTDILVRLGVRGRLLCSLWLLVSMNLVLLSRVSRSKRVELGPTGPLAEAARRGGDPQAQLRQLWTLYQQGDMAAARSLAQQLYETSPDNPHILYMASLVVADRAKQIEMIRLALAIDPDNLEYQVRLTQLLKP